MASVVFFVNQKGEEVVSRHFRYHIAYNNSYINSFMILNNYSVVLGIMFLNLAWKLFV